MNPRKNKGERVGRAGLEPATYGLKGRISKSAWARVFLDGIARPATRDPSVAQERESDEDVMAALRRVTT